MPLANRYTLTVTAAQARVLQEACELLARCHMGQFEHIGYAIDAFEIGGRTGHEHYQEIATALRQAIFSKECRHCGDDGIVERTNCPWCRGTGREPLLHAMGSYGIRSEELPDKARVSWDLYTLVRHRLAWDRRTPEDEADPLTRMMVQYDDPTTLSREPRGKIEATPERT